MCLYPLFEAFLITHPPWYYLDFGCVLAFSYFPQPVGATHSRHKVAYMHDVFYDAFLITLSPKGLYHVICPTANMFAWIHSH